MQAKRSNMAADLTPRLCNHDIGAVRGQCPAVALGDEPRHQAHKAECHHVAASGHDAEKKGVHAPFPAFGIAAFGDSFVGLIFNAFIAATPRATPTPE